MYNFAVRKYYGRLRNMFPCIRYQEGRFLADFKLSLKEYSMENPHCAYSDIVKAFGEPQKVLKDYFENQEETEPLTINTGKRGFKRIIAGMCITGAIIYIIFCTSLYAETKHTIVDERNVIIIEKD